MFFKLMLLLVYYLLFAGINSVFGISSIAARVKIDLRRFKKVPCYFNE